MNTQLTHRIKSFLWRAGGMAFVAIVAYVTSTGDIFELDWNIVVNTGTLVFLGLIASEITKFLNNK